MERTQYSNKNIHGVSDTETNISSQNGNFDGLIYFNITVSNMCALDDREKHNRNKAYTCVEIDLNTAGVKCKLHLRAKIDSGAQGNTLPLRTLKQMFPHHTDNNGKPVGLQPATDTQLTAYNKTIIKCYGSIVLPIQTETVSWQKTKFYVVDSPGQTILGLPSSEKIKLITLHCSVETKQE